MKIFVLSGFILATLLSATTHAKETESLIYFNFEKMSIGSRGVYTPSNEKQKMDALNAEMAARKNGIENITNYLTASCQDVNSASLSLQPKYESMFRSQGTEIYGDGALQVNLMAAYNTVFNYKNSANLKTAAGESIVFSLPSAIPANVLKCGTPALSFVNTSNQQIRIQIIPARTQKQVSAQEKLIKLVFDTQRKSLVVENEKDAQLLKDANIVFNDDGITFVSVAVLSKN